MIIAVICFNSRFVQIVIVVYTCEKNFEGNVTSASIFIFIITVEYSEARRQAQKAENSSDLQSEASLGRGHRRYVLLDLIFIKQRLMS